MIPDRKPAAGLARALEHFIQTNITYLTDVQARKIGLISSGIWMDGKIMQRR